MVTIKTLKPGDYFTFCAYYVPIKSDDVWIRGYYDRKRKEYVAYTYDKQLKVHFFGNIKVIRVEKEQIYV